MKTPLIYDFDFPEFAARVTSWGEPKYRGKQIWEGIYKNLWLKPEEFSNLPKTLREKIGEMLTFDVLTPVLIQESKDAETVKILGPNPVRKCLFVKKVFMRGNIVNTGVPEYRVIDLFRGKVLAAFSDNNTQLAFEQNFAAANGGLDDCAAGSCTRA